MVDTYFVCVLASTDLPRASEPTYLTFYFFVILQGKVTNTSWFTNTVIHKIVGHEPKLK
jgi:hypothetical protein